MAGTPNNSAQAIGFVQSYARPIANAVLALDLGLQKIAAMWSSLSIATVIPSDSNVIQDGNTLSPLLDSQIQTMISDCATIETAIAGVRLRMQAIANAQYVSPV